MLILFAFALLGSCVSGGKTSDEDKRKAFMKVREGDYYLFQYQIYDYERISGKEPVILTPTRSSRYREDEFGEGYLVDVQAPSGVRKGEPSAEDIDRAVAAYEEALKLHPSNEEATARLAKANSLKQQQDQRFASPLSDEDFEIRQNQNNTITITGFKRNIDDLVIPERIYGLPVTVITARVFSGKRIRSVVIPDTVTTIGEGAFSGNLLTGVVIGKGVKVIPANAFSGNPGLTEISIPDSVTEIGNSAFKNCGLTGVTLGSGLKTIGSDAFSGNKLTSVAIPDSVTTIGDSVFTGNSLTGLTLGSSIQTIGSSAFSGHKLTEVTLPAGLTSIGRSAFAGNQLTSVTLPASLSNEKIGQGAFASNQIRSVTINRIPPPTSVPPKPRKIPDGYTSIFDKNPVTVITLPENLTDEDLWFYGFDNDFRRFYGGQGRAAGTYEKNGPIWARSRAGGIE